MSIKYFSILWVRLQLEEKNKFHFSIPVPLTVIQEISDGTLDLLEVICLFARVRNYADNSAFVSINTVKELVQMTMKLIDSLTEGEPYDLVHVAADKVNISIQIR